MKEQKIKVLAVMPMEPPKEIELDNTLEAMQNFVGELIECITSAPAHPRGPFDRPVEWQAGWPQKGCWI